MNPARNPITPILIALALALTGCTGEEPAPEADQSQTAGDSTTPSDSPPPGLGNATLLADVPGGTALSPGRYAMAFGEEEDLPLLVVDIPAGFVAGGDPYEFADGMPFRHFDTWTVADVAMDPCGGTDWADPGPGVDDLADALATLPVWETTRPTPITIGGHEGVSMELNVPARLPAACPEPLPGWRDHQGDTQGIATGKTQHLWIVDVDGRRVMILAGYFPGEEGPSRREAHELVDIAEGARFIMPTPG